MKYSVNDMIADVYSDIASGRMNDYSLTEKDMKVALALFKQNMPRRVLDFGTNEGSTAAFLLDNCPWIERWVGVDLDLQKFGNRGIVPRVAGSKARNDGRFVAVLTDETVPGFQRVLREWQRQTSEYDSFDAIIMDANHEDWATKRDTEACEMFANSPCLWLWHDYDVESRQHSNGRPFSLKSYIDGLVASGRNIMLPDEENRDPWKCCSLAWELR